MICMPQVEPHTGKKTVLVTGGAGFIGSWVADSLLARGDDVVIVDEVNRGFCELLCSRRIIMRFTFVILSLVFLWYCHVVTTTSTMLR